MILKALDTLHISSVSSHNILAGQSFELDDHFGRQLIERGLAVEVGGSAPAAAVTRKSGSSHRTKVE
jgi:hypothetical protein